MTLDVERDGVDRTYVLRVGQFPYEPRYIVLGLLGLLSTCLIASLAVYVLIRGATVEAFALWAFASVWFQPAVSVTYHTPDWVAVLSNGVISDLVGGLYVAGVIIVALRATGRWAHRTRYEWAAVYFGFAVYLLLQSTDVIVLGFGGVPPAFAGPLNTAPLSLAGFIAGAVVLIALVRARGLARVRLRWVAIGFACIVTSSFEFLVLAYTPVLDYSTWPYFLGTFLTSAGFCTLAFAILRRDLFDVGFVVNRAAIYSALTAVVVAAFAGLNWSIGMLLKSTGFALPIDVILAGAVGLSLTTIQRRVDRIIDRLFFRQRYEAELRLRRVARALAQTSNEGAIAHGLIDEPVEALGLHAAALYRLTENGDYDLTSSRGWPEGSPQTVTASDPLVLHLAGVHEALRLEKIPHDAAFLHGTHRPRIAFPLWGQLELVAFALYSSHRNGATLDPDEVEAIERLAAAASVAFERVSTLTLRQTLAALKSDFDAVRSKQDELLEALLGARNDSIRALPSETA